LNEESNQHEFIHCYVVGKVLFLYYFLSAQSIIDYLVLRGRISYKIINTFSPAKFLLQLE